MPHFSRALCARSGRIANKRSEDRLARFPTFPGRRRFHVGAQDRVDTGLVPALLPEPGQQVSIQPHGHNGFSGGPYHLDVFQNSSSLGRTSGSDANAEAYLGIAHVAQLIPTSLLVGLRVHIPNTNSIYHNRIPVQCTRKEVKYYQHTSHLTISISSLLNTVWHRHVRWTA
jgi:hypothetical protein